MNNQITKLFLTALSLLLLTCAIACGSSTSSTNDTQSDQPQLTDATANLEKPALNFGPSETGPDGESGSQSEVTNDDIDEPVTSNPGSSITFSLRRFLWKPDSERDGNLVVLVDRERVRVEVFGSVSETLVDFGPSNGRGSTARGSRPGGGYGGNIRVTFFDSEGRQVLLNDGRPEVIIPNGADRVEFILP